MASMGELIEALQILNKYDPPDYPTCCAHDTLYVHVDPEDVSDDDQIRLEELGFIPTNVEGDRCFLSFRYGSS